MKEMIPIEVIRTRNINRLIEQYGGLNPLSKLLNRQRPQIDGWAKNYKNGMGTPRYVSRKSCRYIEQTLNLPAGWMDINHDPKPESNENDNLIILSADGVQNAKFGFTTEWLAQFGLPHAFMLARVTNDALAPDINAEDIALISKGKDDVINGCIYMIKLDTAVKLARLYISERKTLLFDGKTAVEMNTVNIIGRVTHVIKHM